MLIKINRIWVNPDHIVAIMFDATDNSTIMRMVDDVKIFVSERKVTNALAEHIHEVTHLGKISLDGYEQVIKTSQLPEDK